MINDITITAEGYTKLEVFKYTGRMHAEIIGTKFVLQAVRITPVKPKHIQTWKINGKGQYLTINTPNKAAADIKRKILLLFTAQGCCSAIQAPIVRAQISGKIISFSPLNSANQTMDIAINIPKIYRSSLTVFKTFVSIYLF